MSGCYARGYVRFKLASAMPFAEHSWGLKPIEEEVDSRQVSRKPVAPRFNVTCNELRDYARLDVSMRVVSVRERNLSRPVLRMISRE